MTSTTVAVIWPDGSRTVGGSWEDLERQVRRMQWHRFTRLGFRLAMRHRARVWSGSTVSVFGTSEALFRSLEAAGMLRVEEGAA